MSVAIIDYGSGNLHSAAKAFERAARSMENPQKIVVTRDPEAVYRADRIVLPGVGASLGLDRLLAAMEELNLLPKTGTPAPVLVVQFSADRLGDYQKMARALRSQGIGVEVFPEAKKVGQQLQYAEKRGFRVALIAGPDEFDKKVWKVKDLAKREEKTVSSDEVATAIRAIMM